jgi:hypothetical protein
VIFRFPSRRKTLLALASLLATGTVTGCGLVDPPKRLPEVETFRVDIHLLNNTCGYGGLAIDTNRQLDGVLRGYAGAAATWQWSGQTEASGSSTSSGHYQFIDNSAYELVAADTSIGYPGCSVTQRTELTFTVVPIPTAPVDAGTSDAGDDAGLDAGLDAGAAAAYALAGEMRIDVTPNAGTDCTPILGANGGTWSAIPCQAQLTVTGVPKP